jgi:hypothetical protein
MVMQIILSIIIITVEWWRSLWKDSGDLNIEAAGYEYKHS